MLKPRRNTVFLAMQNLSDCEKVTLYYKTYLYAAFSEDACVTLPLKKGSEYAAYYFNLSATKRCAGRLKQFKLVFQGTGDITVKRYSFEEEKSLCENAGTVVSPA